MAEFSHLWNSLPKEERKMLFPYVLEVQLRELERAKRKAIKAHKRFLDDINEAINQINKELNIYRATNNERKG